MYKGLKKRRKELGLTQVEVARLCDMTPRAYQYIEAGQRSPNIKTALRIAKALQASAESLFSEQ